MVLRHDLVEGAGVEGELVPCALTLVSCSHLVWCSASCLGEGWSIQIAWHGPAMEEDIAAETLQLERALVARALALATCAW